MYSFHGSLKRKECQLLPERYHKFTRTSNDETVRCPKEFKFFYGLENWKEPERHSFSVLAETNFSPRLEKPAVT